jgi:hypothetical protein
MFLHDICIDLYIQNTYKGLFHSRLGTADYTLSRVAQAKMQFSHLSSLKQFDNDLNTVIIIPHNKKIVFACL